jgi:oxygen-dependent protoporphyrinogen oxidase
MYFRRRHEYSFSEMGTGGAAVKTVGIIGGGITGLSVSYYLRKRFGDAVKSVILEKSSRCGGWIKTTSRTDGNEIVNYEQGPRTIRPAGVSGMNTLDLIEELGLSGQVLFVKKDHPAAKTRFIYHKEKLVKLPSDMKVLFRKQEPFDKPLIFAGFRDLVKWRQVI